MHFRCRRLNLVSSFLFLWHFVWIPSTCVSNIMFVLSGYFMQTFFYYSIRWYLHSLMLCSLKMSSAHSEWPVNRKQCYGLGKKFYGLYNGYCPVRDALLSTTAQPLLCSTADWNEFVRGNVTNVSSNRCLVRITCSNITKLRI